MDFPQRLRPLRRTWECDRPMILDVSRPIASAEATGLRIRDLLRVAIPILALAAPAAAQDVATQFWPEVDTFVKLGEGMRLYFPLSNTRTGSRDSIQDGTAGIYFDYYTFRIWKLSFDRKADTARKRLL